MNLEVLRLADRLAEYGNRNAISDVGVAGLMALGGLKGACLNVEINLGSIKKKSFVEEKSALIEEAQRDAAALAESIEEKVHRRMAE